MSQSGKKAFVSLARVILGLAVLALASFLVSCAAPFGAKNFSTVSVTFAVGRGLGSGQAPESNLAASSNVVPRSMFTNVTQAVLTIAGPDMSTITVTQSIGSSGIATISANGVPQGTGRVITLVTKSPAGLPLTSGTTTTDIQGSLVTVNLDMKVASVAAQVDLRGPLGPVTLQHRIAADVTVPNGATLVYSVIFPDAGEGLVLALANTPLSVGIFDTQGNSAPIIASDSEGWTAGTVAADTTYYVTLTNSSGVSASVSTLDASQLFFVSSTPPSSPSGALGSSTNPNSDLASLISSSGAANGVPYFSVFIAGGSYNSSTGLTFNAYANLIGGFNSAVWKGGRGATTTLSSSSSTATAVTYNNASAGGLISGLTIQGPSSAFSPAYGLLIQNASDPFVVRNSSINGAGIMSSAAQTAAIQIGSSGTTVFPFTVEKSNIRGGSHSTGTMASIVGINAATNLVDLTVRDSSIDGGIAGTATDKVIGINVTAAHSLHAYRNHIFGGAYTSSTGANTYGFLLNGAVTTSVVLDNNVISGGGHLNGGNMNASTYGIMINNLSAPQGLSIVGNTIDAGSIPNSVASPDVDTVIAATPSPGLPIYVYGNVLLSSGFNYELTQIDIAGAPSGSPQTVISTLAYNAFLPGVYPLASGLVRDPANVSYLWYVINTGVPTPGDVNYYPGWTGNVRPATSPNMPTYNRAYTTLSEILGTNFKFNAPVPTAALTAVPVPSGLGSDDYFDVQGSPRPKSGSWTMGAFELN